MLRKAFRAIRLTALFIDCYVEQFERQILDGESTKPFDEERMAEAAREPLEEPGDDEPAPNPVFIPPEALDMVRPKPPKPKSQDAGPDPAVEMKR